jgi:hypothetical protein
MAKSNHICGFLFATFGSVWSFVVIDKLSGEIKRLSNEKANIFKQMQSLNSIASEYFIANQQGDLIFILDRATPVRNMIGTLAIAKKLDYRQTYDAYEKLNDETRKNLTFANFNKLKQLEKEIIVTGQERIPVLMAELFEIDKAINNREATQKKNRVIGLISSILGTFLLLCVNLISEKGRFAQTIK